jgi:hypothetical protein
VLESPVWSEGTKHTRVTPFFVKCTSDARVTILSLRITSRLTGLWFRVSTTGKVWASYRKRLKVQSTPYCKVAECKRVHQTLLAQVLEKLFFKAFGTLEGQISREGWYKGTGLWQPSVHSDVAFWSFTLEGPTGGLKRVFPPSLPSTECSHGFVLWKGNTIGCGKSHTKPI